MKVSTTTSTDSAVMGIYLPEYPSFRRAGSNDKTYGQVVSLTTDNYYTYIWQFNERSVTLLSMTLDKLNVSKNDNTTARWIMMWNAAYSSAMGIVTSVRCLRLDSLPKIHSRAATDFDRRTVTERTTDFHTLPMVADRLARGFSGACSSLASESLVGARARLGFRTEGVYGARPTG